MLTQLHWVWHMKVWPRRVKAVTERERIEGLLNSPVSSTREIILDVVQTLLCPEQWGIQRLLYFCITSTKENIYILIHCIFKLFSGHLEYSNFVST